MSSVNFSGTPLSGVAALDVTFSGIVSGISSPSYDWNFGDGSPNGTGLIETHSYPSGGIYTVTLTASGTNAEYSGSYIIDNFSGGYSSFWNPSFTGWALYQYPPTTGDYVSVAETDDTQYLMPTGTYISGNFDLYFTFKNGPDNSGANTSVRFQLHDPCNGDARVVQLGYWDDYVRWFGSGTQLEASGVAFVPYIEVPAHINRQGDVVTGQYFYSGEWETFASGITMTCDNLFIEINGATDHGLTNFEFYAWDDSGVFTNPLGTGWIDSETKSDYVYVGMSAVFSADVTSGVAPLSVTFDSTNSSGYPSGYYWDFGDGTTSTSQNPSHTYVSGGIYDVALTVSGAGVSDTTTTNGYIYVGMSAVFSADVTSGVSDLTVTFDGTNSSGFPSGYLWDFGDGNTSSSQNPTHTYTSGGIYDVILTVSGNGVSATTTETEYIYVGMSAVFSAIPTSGSSPLVVVFNSAASSGVPTSWSWDFGDGNTSNLQNPNNVYASGGVYDVSLTVSGNSVEATSTYYAYITVNDSGATDFTATPLSGYDDLLVTFTNASIPAGTGWLWDFGDGNTSTLENPTNTYTSPGVYDVSLTTWFDGLYDTEIKVGYISVSGYGANFSASPTTGKSDLTVDFTDTSSGVPDTWLWDFGDGSSGVVQNPSHTYTTAGIYNISLTVSGATWPDEYTLTQTSLVTVYPSSYFTADLYAGLAPLDVDFTSSGTLGNPTTYLWGFGDGYTSVLEHPIHTYANAGNYTVSLTVTKDGLSDVSTRGIEVTLDPSHVPTGTATDRGYKILLTNKNPYPSKIWGDYIVSKVDVVTNRALSYMADVPIELWLSWNGDWAKYSDSTTSRYGNTTIKTSTDYIGSPITNCLGVAFATIGGVRYRSNLMRYNFFEGPGGGPQTFIIDANSGVIDRSAFDIFDGSGRVNVFDRMWAP